MWGEAGALLSVFGGDHQAAHPHLPGARPPPPQIEGRVQADSTRLHGE